MPADPSPARRPARAARFTYGPFVVDEAAGAVRCHYRLDAREFVETITVGDGLPWTPAAYEAARLVHLLAGVSYYKAGAPRTIDLGDVVVRDGERAFLRSFYVDGLGEFAYRNDLQLDDIELVGGRDAPPPPRPTVRGDRPLVPFGGGIDSIVSVDLTTKAYDDVALFVMSRAGDRFAAIERAAAVTGLPILRAQRELDAQILRPADPSALFNGHVPITGVLSAVAVLVAVLHGRSPLVLSNEWSASRPTLVVDGRAVNHQWSKSDAFEDGFRAVLAGVFGGAIDYLSLLRPFSELWVARRFAALTQFHHVTHSCNRAFRLDPDQRLDRWCGRCDKCCFIDLILAPFMDADALAALFDGAEPLQDPTLLPTFRDLLGLADGIKPFECVGDVDECRSAAVLAAERADRADRASNPVLAALLAELGEAVPAVRADATRLLRPLGPHHLPDALAAVALG